MQNPQDLLIDHTLVVKINVQRIGRLVDYSTLDIRLLSLLIRTTASKWRNKWYTDFED